MHARKVNLLEVVPLILISSQISKKWGTFIHDNNIKVNVRSKGQKMTQYSEVAIGVVKKFQCSNIPLDPASEWDAIAKSTIRSQSSIEKDCPRAAFLGLCDAGCVIGIPSGNYTKSIKNKRYAVQAVVLLRKDPALSSSSAQLLWEKVMSSLNIDTTKAHNDQMNIVLDLWNHGYIR